MADKKVVLVIDDDPAICDSVKAILDGNGFDTKVALSGKDGVEVFKETNPDVVLCDMMMEHIDEGTKVAKIVKQEKSDTPVFLLSSIGDATANNIGLSELGFNGVFQKPVNFDLLLSVIGKFVN
jgi:DNA-binding response OmpR family regulator